MVNQISFSKKTEYTVPYSTNQSYAKVYKSTDCKIQRLSPNKKVLQKSLLSGGFTKKKKACFSRLSLSPCFLFTQFKHNLSIKRSTAASPKIRCSDRNEVKKLKQKISNQKLFLRAQREHQPNEINFFRLSKLSSISLPTDCSNFNSKQISFLTTKNYLQESRSYAGKKGILQAAYLAEKNQKAMQTVILPALFNRNLIISSATPADSDKIIKNFYVDRFTLEKDDTVPALINAHGYLVKGQEVHQLLVLRNKHSNQLCGAIHFKIDYEAQKALSCYVYSLKVYSESRAQGYGFLLLACAIQTAKEKQCASIKLKSSEDAFFYYDRLGFIVDTDTIESHEEWEGYDEEEKEAIASEHDHTLILELQEERVQNILEERLEKAIEPTH